MEDVLTEIPPPSRFFQEDLNNFTPPSPPLPSPFLLFSQNPDGAAAEFPIRPSLLIVALSSPSLHLFHSVSSKSLIGTLILPETPFSGNSIGPSLTDKSCNVYSLPNSLNPESLTLLVSFQCPIAAERCHAVAKLLTSHQMVPQRVLILDSVQTLNFRGKLSRDEAAAFKLETTAERKAPSLKLEYFPSGSVVDGLGAALLAACEIKNIRAALCVTWPQFGAPVLSLIRSHIFRAFDLELSIDSGCEDYVILGQDKDHQHPCNERKGTGETISDKDHFLQASQLLNNDSDQTTGERLTKRKKNSCQKIDGRTHLSICYILNATILCIEQHHLQALQSPLLQLFAAAASTLIKVGEELQ